MTEHKNMSNSKRTRTSPALDKRASSPSRLDSPPSRHLTVERLEEGKSQSQQLAAFFTRGVVPVASLVTQYIKDVANDEVSLTDTFNELMQLSDASVGGDLAHAERLLSAQMMALNTIFTGLAHRARTNSVAGYLGAAETYTKLALRAQSQSRQTALALFEMKNPRPVAFVQQANFAAGHQQVNNITPPANVRPSARTRAEQNSSAPNKLGMHDVEGMDTGTQGQTGRADQAFSAVGEVNRTKDRSR